MLSPTAQVKIAHLLLGSPGKPKTSDLVFYMYLPSFPSQKHDWRKSGRCSSKRHTLQFQHEPFKFNIHPLLKTRYIQCWAGGEGCKCRTCKQQFLENSTHQHLYLHLYTWVHKRMHADIFLWVRLSAALWRKNFSSYCSCVKCPAHWLHYVNNE